MREQLDQESTRQSVGDEPASLLTHDGCYTLHVSTLEAAPLPRTEWGKRDGSTTTKHAKVTFGWGGKNDTETSILPLSQKCQVRSKI